MIEPPAPLSPGNRHLESIVFPRYAYPPFSEFRLSPKTCRLIIAPLFNPDRFLFQAVGDKDTKRATGGSRLRTLGLGIHLRNRYIGYKAVFMRVRRNFLAVIGLTV